MITRFVIFVILICINFCFYQAGIAKPVEETFSVKLLEQIDFNNNLDNFNTNLSTPSLALNENPILTFENFITYVRNNYPDIISAKLEKQIASSKRLEAQGAFDPSINSRNFYNHFNSSSAPGVDQSAFTSDTSFDILTRQGARFGLGAKYAEGDIKTPISPTGDTGEYYIKLQIPLLRDSINNSSNIKEKSAKLNEIIADFLLYRSQLMITGSAANAYWDWVAAKRTWDVESGLRDLINGQVAFVGEQSNLGNLPQIATVEAERELQSRIGKVNSSLRILQNSTINLSKFLWNQNGHPCAMPLPSQVPEFINPPKAITMEELQEAKLRSLATRPEFKAIDLTREISRLEHKLAKNQILPRLDAYLNQGIETGQDSIGPTLEAGINLSLPLRVRSAKGQMQQAEFKIKQLNLQERQLIQNVFMEIEDTASQINTAYSRYIAANSEYQLSQKLEDAEREIFAQGDSTLFVVIRRQRDTVVAKTELIKTITDYYKARARFMLVQGELI